MNIINVFAASKAYKFCLHTAYRLCLLIFRIIDYWFFIEWICWFYCMYL